MSIDYSDWTITPTTYQDVIEFFPKLAPCRMKAVTIKIQGKIYGIGGYLIAPDGTKIMFMEAKEEDCKLMPVIVYRATLQFFDQMKKSGVKKVIARLDNTREKAEKFLKHLGFERLYEKNGEVFYQWRASDSWGHSEPLALS